MRVTYLKISDEHGGMKAESGSVTAVEARFNRSRICTYNKIHDFWVFRCLGANFSRHFTKALSLEPGWKKKKKKKKTPFFLSFFRI